MVRIMMMIMWINKMLKMSSLRKSLRKKFTNSIIRFAGYALEIPIILLECRYFLKILHLRSVAECCGVVTEIQRFGTPHWVMMLVWFGQLPPVKYGLRMVSSGDSI
jgi:hypothetical protein